MQIETVRGVAKNQGRGNTEQVLRQATLQMIFEQLAFHFQARLLNHLHAYSLHKIISFVMSTEAINYKFWQPTYGVKIWSTVKDISQDCILSPLDPFALLTLINHQRCSTLSLFGAQPCKVLKHKKNGVATITLNSWCRKWAVLLVLLLHQLIFKGMWIRIQSINCFAVVELLFGKYCLDIIEHYYYKTMTVWECYHCLIHFQVFLKSIRELYSHINELHGLEQSDHLDNKSSCQLMWKNRRLFQEQLQLPLMSWISAPHCIWLAIRLLSVSEPIERRLLA